MGAKTWILVANASTAKLYQRHTSLQTPEYLRGWSHEDSRKHAEELIADSAAGRSQQSFGHGARPAIDPKGSPKENEKRDFAAELGSYLNEERKQGGFEALILVASPEFLGLLRETLDGPSQASLTLSVAKDYTHASAEELQEYLNDYQEKS
ncbi:host attachment protein [Acidithiobacillus sp. AMEEHan]|uniref:host attachment protein n=1 Tax=Acidithiobacillus sp. AMEEHan TaxID=2994951 RepID=UPI0027E431B4|nr:host attachment protein [Acidithiobacillus sp. AMEEHan]